MGKHVNKYNEQGIYQWVADSTSRRVPLFVTARFKLDKALDIRAKYGEGAVFQKTANGSAKLVTRGEKVKVTPAPKRRVVQAEANRTIQGLKRRSAKAKAAKATLKRTGTR